MKINLLAATDVRYALQAKAFRSQCAQWGWSLTLVALENPNLVQALIEDAQLADFPLESVEYIFQKRSGSKWILPYAAPSDAYILTDTDIVILDADFFSAFAPYDGASIRAVLDKDLTWGQLVACDKLKEKDLYKLFPWMREMPVWQTATIGLTDKAWRLLSKMLKELTLTPLFRERSFGGDQMLVNVAFYALQDAEARRSLKQISGVLAPDISVEAVSPAACLTIRKNGSGPSSKAHRPNLIRSENKIFYRREPVLALHSSFSHGEPCSIADYHALLSGVSES